MFFFQFGDGVRVASIPRHIQTNFFKLVTLFQGIFLSATSRHKCGDILPPLKFFCCFLVILNEKPPLYW